MDALKLLGHLFKTFPRTAQNGKVEPLEISENGQ